MPEMLEAILRRNVRPSTLRERELPRLCPVSRQRLSRLREKQLRQKRKQSRGAEQKLLSCRTENQLLYEASPPQSPAEIPLPRCLIIFQAVTPGRYSLRIFTHKSR